MSAATDLATTQLQILLNELTDCVSEACGYKVTAEQALQMILNYQSQGQTSLAALQSMQAQAIAIINAVDDSSLINQLIESKSGETRPPNLVNGKFFLEDDKTYGSVGTFDPANFGFPFNGSIFTEVAGHIWPGGTEGDASLVSSLKIAANIDNYCSNFKIAKISSGAGSTYGVNVGGVILYIANTAHLSKIDLTGKSTVAYWLKASDNPIRLNVTSLINGVVGSTIYPSQGWVHVLTLVNRYGWGAYYDISLRIAHADHAYVALPYICKGHFNITPEIHRNIL